VRGWRENVAEGPARCLFVVLYFCVGLSRYPLLHEFLFSALCSLLSRCVCACCIGFRSHIVGSTHSEFTHFVLGSWVRPASSQIIWFSAAQVIKLSSGHFLFSSFTQLFRFSGCQVLKFSSSQVLTFSGPRVLKGLDSQVLRPSGHGTEPDYTGIQDKAVYKKSLY
jgi:hypothetical protein